MQTTNNLSECINWIEEAISKKYIKYYEYKEFHSIQKIGSGNFSKVYRAKWKNSEQNFALKSLINLDNAAVKEVVQEVIIKYPQYLICNIK
ncbi:hypothetical protein C1645_772643 [Glomus cerebriforme]|uniref:Protein kinase domain-containing protein n=1 Tax=Glomus cerebriforme TaxID=658196 RepID=A0A397SWH9_9GLOM|nr:hypothetical protein C1645_772643 [Glomus cerebriforme]